MILSQPVPDVGQSTVLVVDDDRSLCTTLALALRKRGLRAVIAHDLAQASEQAKSWNPARAIVDLRIGEASGLQAVAELRNIRPDMRIVVLTGFGSIATAVEAIKLGATHYLAKPAELEEIISSFDRVEPSFACPPASTPTRSLDLVEWEHLQRVLSDCSGNVSEAARRLRMHRRSLQRKLARGRPDSDAR